MAFLGQLQAKFQEIKTQVPQVGQVLEQANKAKQNLVPVFNKCTQQLDSLGKILQVNIDRKPSPIDILPSITAHDQSLEGAVFKYNYDESKSCQVVNLGSCVAVKYDDGTSADLTVSFLPDEEFHLELVTFHWGTEPMNGSEHTVGGVGYAGEAHFIHRSLKHPNLETALKQPNGVLSIAVFLNETHGNNNSLQALIDALPNVRYKGSESALGSFPVGSLLPGNEKNKEFWVYEGSETIEPFRETVKWVVFRSAMPISSEQLEKLRSLYRSRAEDEVEEKMVSIRPVQPPNSRIVRSSVKSVAQVDFP
ncbi:Eukaryotic-type carbonic anhydrase family protein [Aphelenchoides avenae]|nr:Eukaryotic-type carbonic anhydrase family protein [Aphelenchus avenae]